MNFYQQQQHNRDCLRPCFFNRFYHKICFCMLWLDDTSFSSVAKYCFWLILSLSIRRLMLCFENFLYVLQMGNKGAFIRFEAPDLKPNIVTFSAVVSSTCSYCFLLTNPFAISFSFWGKRGGSHGSWAGAEVTGAYCSLAFEFHSSCSDAATLMMFFCAFNMQPHPNVKPMAYANNFLRMFS